VEVEGGDGGGLTVACADEEGQALAERGRTLELSPPERWVLAFQREGAGWTAATRLTLEVLPTPGGCELSILQHGFQHLQLSECMTIWEFYRRRWRRAIERLARACSHPEN
jgi:Activator of Hsp90 ATPase homolog 1-like protein